MEFERFEPGALTWANVKATLLMLAGGVVLVSLAYAIVAVLRILNF